MMNFPHLFCSGLLFASAAFAANAPLVVAFERFHANSSTVEGGRLLFNELGCANCHGGETGLPARRGPELTGLTHRLRTDWVTKFLADPAGVHPGTSMPQLLTADEAGAVLHYLASLKPKSAAKPKKITYVNGARGRELFHTSGCVGCHEPRKDYRPPDGFPQSTDFTHASVPFPELNEKYSLPSLVEFVSNPLKVRPDGRMPRTALDPNDAADLAAYLLEFEGSNGALVPGIPPFSIDKPAAERGRGIVKAMRCAACHDLPKEVAPEAVPLRSVGGGCLNPEISSGSKGIPRYALSARQRQALSLFLEKRAEEPLTRKAAAALTLQALNCLACHDRDGLGGPDAARKAYFLGDHNLGDTGRYAPPLTGIGRKLNPEWMAKVLSGEYRVRPYLQTKMPEYGAATARLGALLTEVDARPENALPGGDDTAGRKLLGTLGGLGCITCHRWGDRPSLGIQALDLSNMGQRLNPGWLREYLVQPAAYRPGTLMPSFWPDGKAANQEILGGDTDRQIASIYSFAKSANGEPEGFPETSTGAFELIPKDRPIVQRTFMEGVGTHAILVGFPSGTHLAYDGKDGRPALAWKGKFFDAYNTWFSRFAPFEKPPGNSVVKWPAAPVGGNHARFDGYRLDAEGVPTFLLHVGDARVEDRIEGIADGLRRTITAEESVLAKLTISHPEGVAISEEQQRSPGQRSFTYSWK